MTWFKVDDKLWGHPKWLATPSAARGLWVTAGSYCADHGTDGHVRAHVLRTLGHTRRDAAALVASGLWVAESDGWHFHGWAEFQPDAASEKAKREAESDGGALGNHVRWHVRRGIDVPSCGFCSGVGGESGGDRVPEGGPDSPPNPPDPSRPDTRSRSDVVSPSVEDKGERQASIVQFRNARASGDDLTVDGGL